jgi:glycine C-acetyltransferase
MGVESRIDTGQEKFMDDVFFFDTALRDLEKQGLRRQLVVVSGSQGPEVVIDGRRFLNFCSNNYLGLADDPRLVAAASESLRREGMGSGASRLVCGNMAAHRSLESSLARFKGTPAALAFSTGYMANIGIISSLMNREDIVFSDRLNHASIVDGILLSRAKCRRYPHGDMAALEEMLKAAAGFRKRLIVTDAVFSMDGDIAPLDKIVALARRYGCLVMVDEAHALGVLGANGKGAVEHFGLEGEVNIQMGTLSKAAGAFGAYCCGSEALIDFLVNKARSFIYTTGMPPAVAAASQRALEIMHEEPHRRRQLWEHTRDFRREVQRCGFDVSRSETPIIPIVVGEAALAVTFARRLFAKGIFVAAIRPPSVPQGTARLRLTLMATHTRWQLEQTWEQLEQIGKELCII